MVCPLPGEGQSPTSGRRKRPKKILFLLTAEGAENAERQFKAKGKKRNAKVLFIKLILI
jgi:hypothetical protein